MTTALTRTNLDDPASLRFAEASVALAAVMLPAQPPEWVQLLPLGAVEARDGRKWRLDKAEAVLAAFEGEGKPAAIDYEHQSFLAEGNGQPAPAAGWITALEIRDGADGRAGGGGLWGRVEWTERAAAMIAAREYRFLSPAFTFDKTTGQIERLINAGLTNEPALKLAALARDRALRETEETESMDELLNALRVALGLKDDADQAAVTKAVADRVETATRQGAALQAAGAALGLPEDSAADELVAACTRIGKAAGDSPTVEGIATALARRGEPGSAAALQKTVDDLQKEVATLRANGAKASAETKVDAAIESGRLTPAQRDWAVGYATREPDQFDAFVQAQPTIKGGRIVPAADPEGDGGELSDLDRAACRQLGMTEEEFKTSRAALAKRDEDAQAA